MKVTYGLYWCPLGDGSLEKPRPNETMQQAYRRLKRLAREYATRGRFFRVEQRPDGILWKRVDRLEARKLGAWRTLAVGQERPIVPEADAGHLARAKKTASYLRRTGAGTFKPRLEDGLLIVSREA